MQHFRRDNPQKSLALIFSVLLHILLFLLFIYFQWDTFSEKKSLPQKSQEAALEPEPLSDIAALKTGASQFGAPVIFQEEPTFTPPDTQQVPEPVQEPIPEPMPETQPEKEGEPQQPEKVPDQAQQATAFVAEPQAQKTPISFQAPKQPQQQKAQREPEKPQPQPLPQPQPEQKKPSFADLAQGFIQTLRDQGGQDLFERKGNENIRPDMEELKVISYQQKIIWFIQNSFRANNNQEPVQQEPVLLCPTILTLNEDGSILQLQLVESSGYSAFDTYYLHVIRNAAPFPPVPGHIPKPFTFRFTAQHYTQRYAAHAAPRKKPAGLSMR